MSRVVTVDISLGSACMLAAAGLWLIVASRCHMDDSHGAEAVSPATFKLEDDGVLRRYDLPDGTSAYCHHGSVITVLRRTP